MKRDNYACLIMEMIRQKRCPSMLIDWKRFYKAVCKHRLWHPVTAILCKEKPASMPQTMLDQLIQRCQKDSQQTLAKSFEIIRITRQFTSHDIAHYFVKGPMLNIPLYGAIDKRPCRDLDVWVPMDKLNCAVEQLKMLGYLQVYPSYELKGFKEQYYFRRLHDICFFHPIRRIWVELHFSLNHTGVSFLEFQEVKNCPIKFMNVSMTALHHDYHALYLIIHGAVHGWIRLRWLQDIALLIEKKYCDWTQVVSLAQQIQCEHLVLQAFLLVQDQFHIPPPIHMVALKTTQKRAQSLFRLAKRFIESEYEQDIGVRNVSMFLAYRLYNVKMAVHGRKWEAVLNDVWKIDFLFPYLTFPKGLTSLYYVAYPFWILFYICNSFVKKRTS